MKVDVLVVGGGGAAARAAIEAARSGASVRLVVKGKAGKCGLTATARSEILGIAAALGHADPRDSPDTHYHDTMKGGEGFCDPRMVRVLVEEAPDRVRDLLEFGVPFERDGKLLRQQLTDHSTYPRACRVDGITGAAILETLLMESRRLGVILDEQTMVADLLLHHGRVAGAIGLHRVSGEAVLYEAKAVVLATGGMGDAFGPTLSDATMTGDGLALALRAGARLVNMEMHQLIPGVIYPCAMVLSGPLYRLRPSLLNGLGEQFLRRYLPAGVSEEDALQAKVSPYSTSNVSRYIDEAIYREICAGRCSPHGGVFYDFSSCSEQQFVAVAPNSYKFLRRNLVDPTRDRLEVSILFQMINGGVLMVEPSAMTDVPGLFVAGETAGGVRGPDRPGGNSLAEGQVFGARAGRHAAAWARGEGHISSPEQALRASLKRLEAPLRRQVNVQQELLRQALKRTMWDHCLVVKSRRSLQRALEAIGEIRARLSEVGASRGPDWTALLGLENALVVSEAAVLSALRREETRGSHYREDFPATDAKWRRSIVVKADGDQLFTELLEYGDQN